MSRSFPGKDQWEGQIVGPTALDTAMGEENAVMGELLANRTFYLAKLHPRFFQTVFHSEVDWTTSWTSATTTSFANLSGLDATGSLSVLANDIIECRVQFYTKITGAAPAQLRVVSTISTDFVHDPIMRKMMIPVEESHAYVTHLIVGANGTLTSTRLQGRLETGAGPLELYGPARLNVTVLRSTT